MYASSRRAEPKQNKTMSLANDETDQELRQDANEASASEERPASFSSSKTERIYVQESDITNDDVKCGTEFAHSDHPGNVAYLAFVDGHKERHGSLESSDKKTMIRNSIVDELAGRNVRFVRREKDSLFYLLTLQEAREKVAQRLKPSKGKKASRLVS
jgi:hypothetical protein